MANYQLSAASVLFVISRSDCNSDMKVSRSELASALAIWKHVLPALEESSARSEPASSEQILEDVRTPGSHSAMTHCTGP